MASTTPRLGLYKRDPVADAQTNFDLKTMINDNLDKIDANVALKGDVPTDSEIQTMINVHTNKKDNPHGVTTAQVNQIAAKNADALADAYPNGITQMFISNANTGWPGQYGTVVTYKGYSGGPGGTLQIFVPYSDTYGGANIKYRQFKYGDTAWAAWNDYETTAGAQAKVDTHAGDNVKHITAAERTAWNGKASTAVVTTSANGLMSSADKGKLNNIAANANNYSHPATHPPSIIEQDANNRFVTDAEKTIWNGKETTSGAQTKADKAETNAKNFANNLNSVSSKDTRDVAGLPSAYTDSANGQRVHVEFKRVTTIGLPSSAGGTYCTLITDARWVGSSGGKKNQLALTDSGKIFTRVGSTDETAWGDWTEQETTAGAQARVDTHAGDTVAHITASERSTWNGKASTAIATTSANGLMSSSDKSKLDGVAANANNYTHPSTHPPSIIVQDSNNRFMTDAERTKLNGIEAGAQVNDVTSVAGKTGAVALAGTDIPAATTGARGTVQLSTATNSTSTSLAATASAVKAAYDLAAAATTPAEALLAAEHVSCKTVKTGKDANSVFTTVEYRRKSNDTLVIKSVLSGGTSPLYTTRTVTYYAANGTTVSKTETYTLTYDADGDLVSEV